MTETSKPKPTSVPNTHRHRRMRVLCLPDEVDAMLVHMASYYGSKSVSAEEAIRKFYAGFEKFLDKVSETDQR